MDIDLFLSQDMGLEYCTLNLYIMEAMFEDEYNNAVTNEATTAIQDPDTLSQAGTVNGDKVG
jgi:hypothetical protein